jgi:hypothetical protein
MPSSLESRYPAARFVLDVVELPVRHLLANSHHVWWRSDASGAHSLCHAAHNFSGFMNLHVRRMVAECFGIAARLARAT